jgi:TPM domain
MSIARLALRATVFGLLLTGPITGAPARATGTRAEGGAGTPGVGALASPPPELLFGAEGGGAAGLSGRDQASVRRALDRASRTLGSPVAIELVAHLPSPGPELDAATRAAFEGHGFGARAGDPVVLLVSVHDRRAAIETGKGPAGIVPEIDARTITAELARGLTRTNLADHLDHAVVAIVRSAEATHERRRPLARDEPPRAVPPLADGARGPVPAPTADDAPEGSGAEPRTPTPGTPAVGRRSRLPVATAIGILVLLALGLQKRRQLAAARAAAEAQAARDRSTLLAKPPTRPGGGPPSRPNRG